MKKINTLNTIVFLVFLLATSRSQAQEVESKNKFVENFKANNINSDLEVIDLQNNLDKNLGQITNVNSLQDVSPTD